MSLEWIDPPRDYRDEAVDLATKLKAKPGEWARIETGIGAVALYGGNHLISEELESLGIEIRFVHTHGLRGTYGELGDLYARAPKENR